MKNCSTVLTHQHFINIAPMVAAYERLQGLMLLLIERGLHKQYAAQSQKVLRAVKALIRADFSNRQLDLKLRMLTTQAWRERVLKDLGGQAALAAWERRMARFEEREEKPAVEAAAPDPWRKTPERIEEELRQIAHAKRCAKACASPNIYRDPFRVDFEGTFRLAPLPRLQGPRRSALEVLATTPGYMERYDYNAMPLTKMSGFDAPVTVWPAEFWAAVVLESCGTLTSVIPAKERSDVEPGPNPEDCTLLLGPASDCILHSKIQKVRDDKGEDIADDEPP